jgi:hypothetical protein
MKFESANPSVVRSIKQRDLLNTWLRALRKPHPLPAISDFQPDRIGDELADMMGYDVEGEGESARFRITQEGARLAATYGSDHLDPDQLTNRYLDDALDPERYGRVVPCYRACLAHRRPTYSISTLRDPDGKDVSYERLLLPFGNAGKVKQIIGSFKAISIDGGFKVNNLISITSKALPVRVINAVIDRELARRSVGSGAADDIIELN